MTEALQRQPFPQSGGAPVCPPAVYAQIAQILHGRTGISLPDDNASLVVSRLVKHLRQLHLPSFQAYLDWIRQPEHMNDLKVMISALTTNTTRFFREPYHFDIFARDLLPGLQRRARAGERIRLWSAGCSSGEEPYSLAATLLHHWPDVHDFDVRILATDICEPALQIAQTGEYVVERLEGVPDHFRALMLSEGVPGADTVIMPKVLRDLITVRYMNFMDPWPTRGPFQAIFCRNVAIYMDDKVQLDVWSGLIDLMERGGLLFIGHSERIPPTQADRVSLIDRTTFRKT